MDTMFDVVKSYANESAALKTWALSIMGASIFAMVSTSYRKPAKLGWRAIYLIFLPAWIMSSISVYNGTLISRRLVAGQLAQYKQDLATLKNVLFKIDANYDVQLNCFNYGILFYTSWLILYIIWWIITNPETDKK